MRLDFHAKTYYFYPRPPRGGRHQCRKVVRIMREISIHALREEGDCSFPTMLKKSSGFLSTPSARRATSPAFCGDGKADVFLSTPSARRATSVAS